MIHATRIARALLPAAALTSAVAGVLAGATALATAIASGPFPETVRTAGALAVVGLVPLALVAALLVVSRTAR